jgi:ATP/ADP translocase
MESHVNVFSSVSGGVFIFYVVFFSALFAMFAVCMTILLWVLDEKRPTYILNDSIIGSNPGKYFSILLLLQAWTSAF